MKAMINKKQERNKDGIIIVVNYRSRMFVSLLCLLLVAHYYDMHPTPFRYQVEGVVVVDAFCHKTTEGKFHHYHHHHHRGKFQVKSNYNLGIDGYYTTNTNTKLFASSLNNDDDDDDDDENAAAATTTTTRMLQEKAAALRREVIEFEESKRIEQNKIEEEKEEIRTTQKELRDRYSVEIPILKGDGLEVMERCDFPPLLLPVLQSTSDEEQQQQPKKYSRIIAVQAPLPLGIIVGQDNVTTTVDEIQKGGNGDRVGQLYVGDIIRACTACQTTMEQPTWQLLLGGIGQPKTTRMMYTCDDKPLEEILGAISSNTMDPQQRDVWLVIERYDDL